MRNNLKIISILITLCMLSGLLLSTAEASVMPESIKIVLNKMVMQVGETQRIKVSITPANAENYELEYSSSNPQVVSAAIGTLIATAEGIAEIKVNIKGTEISDTVTVTVGDSQKNISVTDITLNLSYIYLQKYDERRIYYTVLPENATDKEVFFTSLNTSIATVDEDGWVYGKKNGNTQIKVQSVDKSITKYIDIYVEYDDYSGEYREDKISVRRVDIYDGADEVLKTVEVMHTQAKQFTTQIYPSNVADKRIRWSSSDDSIAEINENGLLTGISEGTVTIYAVARDNGKRDSITVKIIPYVRYPDSISITPQEGAVFETGQIISFTPKFSPADTTEKKLRWFIHSGCAAVDGTGKVTITGKGKIIIRAYTPDLKRSASYEFEAVYATGHFRKYGEGYNAKSNRAIIIDFDENVSMVSAQENIFAATDEDGNTGYAEIKIIADGKRVTVIPVSGWNTGANYIFIKEGLTDVYGNKVGENLKFKITVRDGTYGQD